jgi:hypothetical protein
MNKRSFLRTVGGASLGLTLGNMRAAFAERAPTPPADLAKDEAFWVTIRAKYRLKPDYINLENGYYCMQPQEVLDYWTERVRGVPNIVLNTPSDPRRSCAIANVGVSTMTPRSLAQTLLERSGSGR